LGFISLVALILFLVSFNKPGDKPREVSLNSITELDVQELNICLPGRQEWVFTFEGNMTTPSVTLFFISFNNLRTNPFGRGLIEELNDVKEFDIQGLNMRLLDRQEGMFTLENNIAKPLGSEKASYYSETYVPNRTLEKFPESSVLQQYRLYKEDQLLSNPGGDNFFLNKASGVIDNDYDHSKFSKRVGKDLADAGSNLLNMMKDMGIGAKIRYIDNHGEIKEERKVGFVATLGNFFKNLVSGLTLGTYTPEGEVKPHGGAGRTKHLFKKIFRDAVVGDIVVGVSRSIIYVGEDIMLAGLNSIEVIPDATIGNFEAGRKATTSIFDNTQVVMDFITDVVPGGEASGRARSFRLAKGLKGLPIINNITTDENGAVELNWKYVRNTKFRKVIETVTSLIPVSI
jgi:hypothetical protein